MKIRDFFEQLIRVHLSFLNNLFSFLYLLFELSTDKERKRIYMLKYLINMFEDDDIMDYYFLFKDSIKEKNSIIFQIIVFVYCAIIESYLLPLLNTFLSYKIVYNDMIYQKFIDKLEYLINNNFSYIYVREYKKDNYSNKVLFKIAFWETLLNIFTYINKYFYWLFGWLLKKGYLINTDYFFYKCEQYF